MIRIREVRRDTINNCRQNKISNLFENDLKKRRCHCG